ncbi:TRI39 ligase, partial [Polypterus senegalus]
MTKLCAELTLEHASTVGYVNSNLVSNLTAWIAAVIIGLSFMVCFNYDSICRTCVEETFGICQAFPHLEPVPVIQYIRHNVPPDIKSEPDMAVQYVRENGKGRCHLWEWKPLEDLTLDPETAHPYLQISEDRKQVKRGDKRQDLLDGPQRFDAWACVLSTQAFNSGRHYWEVDVGNNIDWILGVMKETALRKGTIDMTPSQGYWTLKQYEDQFTALDSIRTSLTLSIRPTAIGMYLDYEEGQFSIYNVNSRTLIYTFTENFSENVYPVFRTYDTCNLKLRLPVEIN